VNQLIATITVKGVALNRGSTHRSSARQLTRRTTKKACQDERALGQYGIPESGLDPIGGLQFAIETPWHPHSMSAPADRVLGPPQTRRNRSGPKCSALCKKQSGYPMLVQARAE
jgi:hypothetical protein